MSAAAIAPRKILITAGPAHKGPGSRKVKRIAFDELAQVAAFINTMPRASRDSKTNDKRPLPWWSVVKFKADRPRMGQRPEWSALVLDFDGVEPDPAVERFARVVYKTRSWTPARPSWRVIIGTDRDIPFDAVERVARRFSGYDPASLKPTQLFFPPGEGFAAEYFDGELLHVDEPAHDDFADLLGVPEPEPAPVVTHVAPPLTRERAEQLYFMVRDLLEPGHDASIDIDDRNDWVRLGMAIHASTGGDPLGLRIWDEVSKRSPKYYDGVQTCASQWATFKLDKPNIATVETLHAKIPPRAEEFPVITPFDEASALMPAQTLEERAAAPEPWPDEDEMNEPLRWLWRPYLPEGRVTLFASPGNLGKSTVAARIARHVLLGEEWPNGEPCPKGSVLWVTFEEEPSEDVYPRFRFLPPSERHRFNVLNGPTFAATLKAVRERRPTLLVIDPLRSLMGAQADMKGGNEVRSFLVELKKVASAYNTTVLAITHTRKQTPGAATNLTEAILGSIEFFNVPRSVLGLIHHEAHGTVFGLIKMMRQGEACWTVERRPLPAPNPKELAEAVWKTPIDGRLQDVANSRASVVDRAYHLLKQLPVQPMSVSDVRRWMHENGKPLAGRDAIRAALRELGWKKPKGNKPQWLPPGVPEDFAELIYGT